MTVKTATLDTPVRRISWVVPLSCILCGFLVLIARRTDQITDSQVWVEEGAQFIPAVLEHGPRTLLTPVNGYLITTSRVITFLALRLGGLDHYPGVSTALGLVLTAALFAFIGTAPLILRGVALLPLAVALVPSDVEVFVVPLYTFWLAGLALFTLVLWQTEDHSRLGLRITVAIVGGLSNPVVIPLAVIATARVLVTRARHEAMVAAALIFPALVQLWVVHGYPSNSALPHPEEVALVMSRFLGYPLLLGLTSEPPTAWVWAAGALHAIAIAVVLVPVESRMRRVALLGLFLLSAATSILRCQPPTLMHPAFAGPRYFFFPFVFLNWLWLDVLLSANSAVSRLLPGAVAALILFSTSKHFNRRHAHLDWHSAVRELSVQGHATLPVHYDGSIDHQWQLKLAPCGNRLCKVP
jgi:hypothetical protein